MSRFDREAYLADARQALRIWRIDLDRLTKSPKTPYRSPLDVDGVRHSIGRQLDDIARLEAQLLIAQEGLTMLRTMRDEMVRAAEEPRLSRP